MERRNTNYVMKVRHGSGFASHPDCELSIDTPEHVRDRAFALRGDIFMDIMGIADNLDEGGEVRRAAISFALTPAQAKDLSAILASAADAGAARAGEGE